MKRFLLFAHSRYYPSGGMEDFIKDYDTLEEAYAGFDIWLEFGGECYSYLEVHIYDSEMRRIIKERDTDDNHQLGPWEDRND